MVMILLKKPRKGNVVPSSGLFVSIAASERHIEEIEWLKEKVRMTGIWRKCSCMK